jgi:hypothetical protein
MWVFKFVFIRNNATIISLDSYTQALLFGKTTTVASAALDKDSRCKIDGF